MLMMDSDCFHISRRSARPACCVGAV